MQFVADGASVVLGRREREKRRPERVFEMWDVLVVQPLEAARIGDHPPVVVLVRL